MLSRRPKAGRAARLTLGLRSVAIITASATSGGHLSPCYSRLRSSLVLANCPLTCCSPTAIAFWAFKGFPARKVPFYLVSQLFGAMVATWCVYGMYKVEFDAIHEALVAAGPLGQASIYTPSGVSQSCLPSFLPSLTSLSSARTACWNSRPLPRYRTAEQLPLPCELFAEATLSSFGADLASAAPQTEFMANLVLAIVVFTCLDGSTFTVSMATVPFVM